MSRAKRYDAEEIIGKTCLYADYLGLPRYGRIVLIEPYTDDTAYVYIEDEDMDYNIHEIITGYTDDKNRSPIVTKYAEIRISTEIQLDL